MEYLIPGWSADCPAALRIAEIDLVGDRQSEAAPVRSTIGGREQYANTKVGSAHLFDRDPAGLHIEPIKLCPGLFLRLCKWQGAQPRQERGEGESQNGSDQLFHGNTEIHSC